MTRPDQAIVIVGAGMAGLAAAHRLRAAGRQALVLEARDRVGGRIWTDTRYAPVELGAEFIHGEYAATWEVVNAAGLATERYQGVRYLGRNGNVIVSDDPLTQRVVALYEQISNYEGPDVSATALLNRLTTPDDPAAGYVLRWLANMEGADPARLSAAELSRERQIGTAGWQNFRFPGGYHQVPAALARDATICLNCAVEQVRYDASGAELTLADGSRLRARRLIITVPLSLLQAGQIEFAPELPAAKRAAIQALAMGHVTKLALWFRRTFWEPFGFLSTDGTVITWWPSGDATYPALMGYSGGAAALALAGCSEAAVIEQGLSELTALFGPRVREEFSAGRLVAWSNDPWSRGAYSYSPIGMGDARAVLAAPVAQTLFFAGEATPCNGHLATVHGALESGYRAAEEVLAADDAGRATASAS